VAAAAAATLMASTLLFLFLGFRSPCLASSQVFQVDVVEAWLLQPPEEEQQGDAAGTASGSSSRGAGVAGMLKTKGSLLAECCNMLLFEVPGRQQGLEIEHLYAKH
jgi:hypothetical protein